MKKFILLIMIMLLLTGCSNETESEYNEEPYPYIKYQHNMWEFDSNNRTIEVRDGYILDQGHSYDIVETENGYDIVLHFVKE